MKSGTFAEDFAGAACGVSSARRFVRSVRCGLLRVPDRVGARELARFEHEGLRRATLAGSDVAHRAAGGDRGIFVDHFLRGRRVAREFVAMLDQQPVRALAAFAIALHAHQHPAALQALAREHEFQLAFAQLLLRPTAARAAASSRGPTTARCRRRTGPSGSCLRSRRSRAGGLPLRRRGACPAESSEGPRVTAQDLKTPSSSRRRS